MDLEEIVHRPVTDVHTVEELSFVVERYILEKKNVHVQINLEKNLKSVPQLFRIQMYGDQVTKLLKAFDVARNYFINS